LNIKSENINDTQNMFTINQNHKENINPFITKANQFKDKIQFINKNKKDDVENQIKEPIGQKENNNKNNKNNINTICNLKRHLQIDDEKKKEKRSKLFNSKQDETELTIKINKDIMDVNKPHKDNKEPIKDNKITKENKPCLNNTNVEKDEDEDFFFDGNFSNKNIESVDNIDKIDKIESIEPKSIDLNKRSSLNNNTHKIKDKDKASLMNINVKQNKSLELKTNKNKIEDDNDNNINKINNINNINNNLDNNYGNNIRNKKDREKLNGYNCELCEKYYSIFPEKKDLLSTCNECSRHRDSKDPILTPKVNLILI